MVFLLEHVMLLLKCPVFKSDLFHPAVELNTEKRHMTVADWNKIFICLSKNITAGWFSVI